MHGTQHINTLFHHIYTRWYRGIERSHDLTYLFCMWSINFFFKLRIWAKVLSWRWAKQQTQDRRMFCESSAQEQSSINLYRFLCSIIKNTLKKGIKTNHFPIKNDMISLQKKFQPNRIFLRPPEFPLKFGSDPFKCKKKLFRLWGSWYSNRPARTHGFNAKIGF